MKTALVIGGNGQDGSFLVEKLAARGYRVVSADIQKVKRYGESPEVAYERLDIRYPKQLAGMLDRTQPDAVFHFAAVHGSSGTPYETVWQDMLAVNTGSVQIILEYLREQAPNSILIYANSGKIFGPEYPARITEKTPMQSSCLYTIAKMSAQDLIRYYRDRYGILASNIFLFNHESERRPEQFFVPKIVRALAGALKGRHERETVYTLDFHCDWGSAEEYADIVVDISEKAPGEDFLLGTGNTHYARTFVESLFKGYKLDYKQYIAEKNTSIDHFIQKMPFRVITEKLNRLVGREPLQTIFDVCETTLKCNYAIDDSGRSELR